jgi:uncharacterized protein YbjT (DUF2867 family)
VIFVAGGTGRLGRQLVHALASSDGIRVLTRDESRGAGLPVQLAIGDIRDRAAVAAAVAGCSTVICAVHGFTGGRIGPETIDRDACVQLIRVAAEHGVARFLLVSVLGASPDHPIALHRMKCAAEQALRDTTLAWTIVRPAAYLETWVEVLGGRLDAGGHALVFGRGENPINFVSVRDVAAVAAIILRQSGLVAETVDVGGPENLTLTDFAERLAAWHGASGRVRRVPRAALRMMSVLATPFAPNVARRGAAALAMDTLDMTFDAIAVQRRFPQIHWHRLADVLDPSLRPARG